MGKRTPLVGREAERERLSQAVKRADAGQGSIVLLAGEAGVGKSRLAEEVAENCPPPVLRGAAVEGASIPYGPIIAALRSYLRSDPSGLDECGALRPHLALLLPELGDPAENSDRSTIFEAVRCAFARIAAEGPATVVLDDLQWSDEATLELLAALASPLREMPLVILAAYRSDGLPRDHMLRWLRNELRRGGEIDEVVLEPLDGEQTAVLLGELLPEAPSPSLVRAIYDRTRGSPFFVEELAAALLARGSLQPGKRGLELAEGEEEPVPETVRDAILIGVADLSEQAQAAVEVAAVAADSVDLGLVATLSSEEGLIEAVESGLLTEDGDGRAGFRHALAREALYGEVPWLRRRDLHRRFAKSLESRAAPAIEVAGHWRGAGDTARAREALVRSARESEALRAHRDAARAAREALELWPEGEEETARIETLERYAGCTELVGQLAEAAKAWRELAAIRNDRGEGTGFAEAQRRLAAVSELKGDRDAAFAARRLAVEAFLAAGRPADAASERLAMANHRRAGAHYSEAIELAEAVIGDADAAERADIKARALGLLGVARAKGGDYEGGLETVRGGLALALERDMTPVAAELYQRLSLVLYDSADYRRAEEALDAALGLCRTDGDADTELACVTCLIYVLRERGEWKRACELGRELIERGEAVWVAEGLVGAIHAFEGKLASARRMLSSSRASSSALGHYNMFIDSTTGLARVAAAEGALDEAAEHCRALLARWDESEDHHYAVWGLRWAAVFFARQGDREGLHACTAALTRMASDGGHDDALAALAQAIGEAALLDGDAETAADQLCRAVDLYRELSLPFERAQVEVRAGIAIAAAGEREQGLERLGDAYRTARKLGAQPLAAEAAHEVAALGDSVASRLGSRAVTNEAALTRRELEVLRHVSVGRTNREIAQELFLSPRTVDMHVRNILRKLDCRSRVEAAHRASELDLLS
jgi:DNA-binding CsgD family transcriptional regulator/tetratricopeptide (TPR) repeat protein